jgi:hypothetical protein
VQSVVLLFSIFTRQIYYNNFLALLYMPKYTKSVRKNNMRKNKHGRSRRGGYWFYPGPGDDEHAFTKLRNNFSSGNWKFWQKKPEEDSLLPASLDYQATPEEPVQEEPIPMPEQVQGSLEYPTPESPTQAPMDNQEAPMEEKSYVPEPVVSESVAIEETPEPTQETQAPITGGRRRRRSRTTKKRKRANMRRRTNKRRRSNKRRR